MAQQFLDRAQVAALGEQVGGEGMAQSVRRRGIGQAERRAKFPDQQLHDPRAEAPALLADEERPVRRQRMGAKHEITVHPLADGRQDRQDALLVTLAGDDQRRTERRGAAVEAERLGDAQAAAVDQGQHRMVAGRNPGFRVVGFRPAEQVAGLGHAQGLGHGVGQFRRPQPRDRWIMQYILFIQKIIETADCRNRPRRRAPRLAGARGEPRPEIRACQPGQGRPVRTFAAMVAEKQQEGGQVAPVGRHRVFRSALLVAQPGQPFVQVAGNGGIEGAFQIRAGGRRCHGKRLAGRYPGRFSHARAVLSITRARKR